MILFRDDTEADDVFELTILVCSFMRFTTLIILFLLSRICYGLNEMTTASFTNGI